LKPRTRRRDSCMLTNEGEVVPNPITAVSRTEVDRINVTKKTASPHIPPSTPGIGTASSISHETQLRPHRTAGCPARSSQDGSWMKQPILSQAGSRQCGAQPPTRSRNAAFSDGGAGSISSALTSVVSTLKSAGGGHYRCAPSGCLSRLLSCLCWMASSQTATHRPVAKYWVQPEMRARDTVVSRRDDTVCIKGHAALRGLPAGGQVV
jgi:hypothetical protein